MWCAALIGQWLYLVLCGARCWLDSGGTWFYIVRGADWTVVVPGFMWCAALIGQLLYLVLRSVRRWLDCASRPSVRPLCWARVWSHVPSTRSSSWQRPWNTQKVSRIYTGSRLQRDRWQGTLTIGPVYIEEKDGKETTRSQWVFVVSELSATDHALNTREGMVFSPAFEWFCS